MTSNIQVAKVFQALQDKVTEEREFCRMSGFNGLAVTLTQIIQDLSAAQQKYENVIASAGWLEERQMQQVPPGETI